MFKIAYPLSDGFGKAVGKKMGRENCGLLEKLVQSFK